MDKTELKTPISETTPPTIQTAEEKADRPLSTKRSRQEALHDGLPKAGCLSVTHMNSGTTIVSADGIDRLTVPDNDPGDSSESSVSALTPRSNGANDGTGSEEESIAVDCTTKPSEVIVKGKVKQIRVKFPPRAPHPPPSSSDESKPRSGGRSRSSARKTRHHQKAQDLPLPVEERAIQDLHHSYSNPMLPSLSRDSLYSSSTYHMGGDHFSRQYSSTSIVNWDSKYRQDILAGIEYFEAKSGDLKDLNNRLVKELDRVNKLNEELEDKVRGLSNANAKLLDEVDEFKIKLDQQGKENMRLEGHALSQWQDRVEIEEKYIRFKQDTDSELQSLKDQVKNLQLKSASSEAQPSKKKKVPTATLR